MAFILLTCSIILISLEEQQRYICFSADWDTSRDFHNLARYLGFMD